MAGATVRIDTQTKETLKKLSAHSGTTMQESLRLAVQHYHKAVFWKEFDLAFTRLKQDESAWSQEQRERREWDVTIADGLEESGS